MAKLFTKLAAASGIVGLLLFAAATLRASLTDDRDGLIWFGNIGVNCVGGLPPRLWFSNWPGPWHGPTIGATSVEQFDLGVADYNRIVWPNGIVSLGAHLSLWPLLIASLLLLLPLTRGMIRSRRRGFEVVHDGTAASEPHAALDRPHIERSGKVKVGRRGAGH